jgi:hypothetical protein
LYFEKFGSLKMAGTAKRKEIKTMGFNLTDEYEEEYERGGYDDVEDMCNQLGLNYDDVYDYSSGSDR